MGSVLARRSILGFGLGACCAVGKASAGTTYYAYDAIGRIMGSPDTTGSGPNYVFDKADNRKLMLYARFVGTAVTSAAFDYQFYDTFNADVKAARVGPYQHYLSSGWKEGRDPSGYFSTTGYLNAYGDVAAAGVNPLTLYDSSGWTEGRNPSGLFSTKKYLSAYPDVAAAGINPLMHFLQSGFFEGRSPFGDGTYPAPT